MPLAVALLGALPEALEYRSAAENVPTVMLIGLLALFGIEAALRLGSAHHEEAGLERGQRPGDDGILSAPLRRRCADHASLRGQSGLGWASRSRCSPMVRTRPEISRC